VQNQLVSNPIDYQNLYKQIEEKKKLLLSLYQGTQNPSQINQNSNLNPQMIQSSSAISNNNYIPYNNSSLPYYNQYQNKPAESNNLRLENKINTLIEKVSNLTLENDQIKNKIKDEDDKVKSDSQTSFRNLYQALSDSHMKMESGFNSEIAKLKEQFRLEEEKMRTDFKNQINSVKDYFLSENTKLKNTIKEQDDVLKNVTLKTGEELKPLLKTVIDMQFFTFEKFKLFQKSLDAVNERLGNSIGNESSDKSDKKEYLMKKGKKLKESEHKQGQEKNDLFDEEEELILSNNNIKGKHVISDEEEKNLFSFIDKKSKVKKMSDYDKFKFKENQKLQKFMDP
jgi:hypothetical protein